MLCVSEVLCNHTFGSYREESDLAVSQEVFASSRSWAADEETSDGADARSSDGTSDGAIDDRM